MSSQFKLISVRKYYGERLALEVDELSICPRQLYIITGPNGSGKTTLLNIMAFLMRPDAGEVVFKGDVVKWTANELQSVRTKVTLLHQSPFLFMGSVGYNLAYGLHLRGYERETIRVRVEEALALVGLEKFQTRDVQHLSGGERRRVALARALAQKPEVLLLDEPLSNIDRATIGELERVVASLPGAGSTVIMATHHIHQTDYLNGHMIAMEEGRLESADYRR
jgi:tungstate transport system ATP-binding protein